VQATRSISKNTKYSSFSCKLLKNTLKIFLNKSHEESNFTSRVINHQTAQKPENLRTEGKKISPSFEKPASTLGRSLLINWWRSHNWWALLVVALWRVRLLRVTLRRISCTHQTPIIRTA
jgi:hypothetical protein